jgi:hypothetical protein
MRNYLRVILFLRWKGQLNNVPYILAYPQHNFTNLYAHSEQTYTNNQAWS